MFSIIVLEEADKEFQMAVQWYEEKSHGLGLRFIESIRQKIEIIQEQPELYKKCKGNFREAVVEIFPFVIVYTFYKREGRITINSIFHTSRNPKKKYRK